MKPGLFCKVLLFFQEKKLTYLAVLCCLLYLKLFVKTSRRIMLSTMQGAAVSVRSLWDNSAEHARLLPSRAAELPGEHYAFQVNLPRDRSHRMSWCASRPQQRLCRKKGKVPQAVGGTWHSVALSK